MAERTSGRFEKRLHNFCSITGTSEARCTQLLWNTISIRLMRLRARSSLSPHVTRRLYNIIRTGATGGRLRARPYNRARTVATARRSMFTRGSPLYELTPLPSIKRSRRANQSMTFVRNYQLVLRKNREAPTLISIGAVIHRLVVLCCDTPANRVKLMTWILMGINFR